MKFIYLYSLMYTHRNILVFISLLLFLQNCAADVPNENKIVISIDEIEKNVSIGINLGTSKNPIPGRLRPINRLATGALSIRYYQIHLEKHQDEPVNLYEIPGQFYNIYLEKNIITNNKQDLITQIFYPRDSGGAWYIWDQYIIFPIALKKLQFTSILNNGNTISKQILFSKEWPKNNSYDATIYSSSLKYQSSIKLGANLVSESHMIGKADLTQICFSNLETGPIKETRLSVKNYEVERSDGQLKKISKHYLLKKTTLDPPLYYYRVTDTYYSAFYKQQAQQDGQVSFILECVSSKNIISKSVIVKKQKIYQ